MNATDVEHFKKLERDISQKRGAFVLFALFAREDLPDRWDLVVAAPWVKSQQEGAEYFVQEIQKKLGSPVLNILSRIVFVQPTDPPVRAINTAMHVEHGQAEIRDSNFFGVPIKHAFIITSQSLAPSAPTVAT